MKIKLNYIICFMVKTFKRLIYIYKILLVTCNSYQRTLSIHFSFMKNLGWGDNIFASKYVHTHVQSTWTYLKGFLHTTLYMYHAPHDYLLLSISNTCTNASFILYLLIHWIGFIPYWQYFNHLKKMKQITLTFNWYGVFLLWEEYILKKDVW